MGSMLKWADFGMVFNTMDNKLQSITHSQTLTPFDAPGIQAF